MNDDYPNARALAEASIVGTFLRRLAQALTAAWQDSQLRRTATRAADVTAGWSSIDCVRYGAVAMATASLVVVALRMFMTPYSAPGIPGSVFLVAAALFTATAVWPEVFQRAWPESIAGRLAARTRRFFHTPLE